jgi:hypothetical protein
LVLAPVVRERTAGDVKTELAAKPGDSLPKRNSARLPFGGRTGPRPVQVHHQPIGSRVNGTLCDVASSDVPFYIGLAGLDVLLYILYEKGFLKLRFLVAGVAASFLLALALTEWARPRLGFVIPTALVLLISAWFLGIWLEQWPHEGSVEDVAARTLARRRRHLPIWRILLITLALVASWGTMLFIASGNHPQPAGDWRASVQSLSPNDPSIVAKAHLQSPNDLTLRDLFLTDFGGTVASSDTLSMTNNATGRVSKVTERALYDLERQTVFLMFFIPFDQDTDELCSELPARVPAWLKQSGEVVATQTPTGSSTVVSSKTAVFTRRVFVYHETDLPIEQLAELTKLFSAAGLDVLFRSQTYLAMKKLEIQASLRQK